MPKKKQILGAAAVLAVFGAALFSWQPWQRADLPESFASGNGRIEATDIDIAAKVAGRVESILVDEGDFVKAGQVLAKMDTAALEASRREAQARLRQAKNAIESARSEVARYLSEKAAAQSVVAQYRVEAWVAQKRLKRSRALLGDHLVSEQQVDDDRAALLSAQAKLRAAEARVMAIEAAIASARSQVTDAESDVEVAQATLERIEADLDDSILRAPRDGRVQFRVAEPGEILGAGGKVLNMVDLTDVYMTFFLPTAAAGRVALGSEVRLVLDASPRYVFPAKVSFVADVAQFTPKTVETAAEREKLMFRVRARIPPELLKKHPHRLKTGVPGMAHVRLDPAVPWPPPLQVRLPK